ncbi:MAG TPA: phosphoribosylaminoimidazolesuccinocarboxamide synthase [Acidimicrobiales bacterium]
MALVKDLGLRHVYSGKVRELFEVDDEHLLMVASDRMSAYDVVMNEPIANKGRVLTGLTDFWVREYFDTMPSALVSCFPDEIDAWIPGFEEATSWHGRSMLVRRAQMVPLECIVRGRLAGQAFDEYVVTGTVHHMAVASGLELTDPFDEPIFTPSTKAESGHDLNIDLDEAANIVGVELVERASELCRDIFTRAAAHLAARGLVLADTKFELGFVDDELVVCDEVLTPDSSRIWPAELVRRGEVPPAYDKQPFRDWLNSIHWDRTPPPPPVPDDVAAITAERYQSAYERITGRSLSEWFGDPSIS